MDKALEELCDDFLCHKDFRIRELAAKNLVPYSLPSRPESKVFFRNNYKPIETLCKLVDEPMASTAMSALTCLINLSENHNVIDICVRETFIRAILEIVMDYQNPLADTASLLLCNLAKSEKIRMLATLSWQIVKDERTMEIPVIECLLNCLLMVDSDKKIAKYNMLANLFADLTRFAEVRKFLCEQKEEDHSSVLAKLLSLTNHSSSVRRTAISAVIKNCCFDLKYHDYFLDDTKINLLPYLLLPLMGPEEYSDEDMDGMPEECQLLDSDKERESDLFIIKSNLESLLLLCSTQSSRQVLRDRKVYPIIRELHKASGMDDEVRQLCERIVQSLMAEEHPDNARFETEAFGVSKSQDSTIETETT